MDSYVTGVVHVVEPTKTYGQKGFRKRLVVLEQDEGDYTNLVPVEFVRDNCDACTMQPGDEITVRYRLRGRSWQKTQEDEVRYFLNAEADAWRPVDGTGRPAESTAVDASAPPPASAEPPPPAALSDDSLPF